MATIRQKIYKHQKLLGLFTNKTIHHPEEDGFLKFHNLEYDQKGFIKVRTGSTLISESPALTSGESFITAGSLFTYPEDFSSYKTKAFFSSNMHLYCLDNDGSFLRIYTYPSGGINYQHSGVRNKRVFPFKDRLIINTGIVTWVQGGATLTVTCPYAGNAKQAQFSGTLQSPSKGDILFLLDIPYEIVDYDPTNKVATLKYEYSGPQLTNEQNFKIIYQRNENLIVYDPTDTRKGNVTGLSGSIYRLGIMSPQAQPVIAIDYASCRYNTGTLNVEHDNAVVTLSGGTFPTGIEDKFIYINYEKYRIKSRDSDTQITLYEKYQGDDNSSLSTWEIYYGELTNEVGYSYAYAFSNRKTGHISNISPITQFKSYYQYVNLQISGFDSTNEEQSIYDEIIIFRTVDGGANLFELARISLGSSYIDKKKDSELGNIPAPRWNNSPPPNLKYCEVWQDRIWGANIHNPHEIVFSASEEQTSFGRAEECFPPTNRLILPQNAGYITGMKVAGDFLYIATAEAIYVVIGNTELNYRLEKVAEIPKGTYDEGMIEYEWQGNIGLLFIDGGNAVYFLSPRTGLQKFSYAIDDILSQQNPWTMKLHRYRDTTRDYLMIVTQNYDAYIYDKFFDAWYYHSNAYDFIGLWIDLAENISYVGIKKLYGGPSTYYHGAMNIYQDGVYTDAAHGGGATNYSAILQTSWLSLGYKNMHKVAEYIRLYINDVSNINIDAYQDEKSTPYLTGIMPSTQKELRKVSDKEAIFFLKDSQGKYMDGHVFSFLINIPTASQKQIEHIEYGFGLSGTAPEDI